MGGEVEGVVGSRIYKRRTEVEFYGGVNIGQAIAEALALSLEREEPVEFSFNQKPIRVDAMAIVASITEEQFYK